MDNIIILVQTSKIFFLMLMFILGLIIGSFLNVLIYRLPIILHRKWQKQSCEILDLTFTIKDDYPKVFNLLFPKSFCQHCRNPIKWFVNIPIIGFLFTKRKCLICKHKISFIYLFVEIFTALIFVVFAIVYSLDNMLFAYLIFASIIISLIMIDLQTFQLPDELTLLLLWLGLLFNLHGAIAGNLQNAVLGVIVGYMLLWGLSFIYKIIAKKEGLGGGDLKFVAGILAWLGVQFLIPLLLLAPLLAIVSFMILVMLRKYKFSQAIAFGPFLGLSAIFLALYGKYILDFMRI